MIMVIKKKNKNVSLKLNEKVRDIMNQLQEKEQKLLDANEELKATNEELTAQGELLLTERNRFEDIIHELGEGVIVINDKNEIEIINKRAKEVLGYTEDQEIPDGYKKFFVLQFWKELNSKQEDIVKKDIKLTRPREAILHITLSRIAREHGYRGFAAIMRDITIEKKIDQMKSDFVANVSHEIRAPMAPMKESVSLLMDKVVGPLTDQQMKFLSILNNNIDRLMRLVNDLLDLSKMEAGKMELALSYVDLKGLIQESVDSVKPYAVKKSINLKSSLDGKISKIYCDKDKILQVMMNLFNNAIKFTPEGGTISVSAKLTEEGKKVQVEVSDTGVGMAQEETFGLFEKFKQLANSEMVKGTGLGLSISKGIVELHGGKIWVVSQVGKGSSFIFTLPIK